MRLSKNLGKEKTNVTNSNVVTFNAPGNYVAPYGKTEIQVGGQGAPGNPAVPGNVSGSNPTVPGNVSGSNPPTGGNYAGTNPSSPGSLAGYNPTYYFYNKTQYSLLNGNVGYGQSYSTTFSQQDYNSNFPTVDPVGGGWINQYLPVMSIYASQTNTSNYSSSYNNTATNGVPPSTSNYLLYSNASSPPTYQTITTNYAQKGTSGGSAYYNPPTPGNAYYNPVFPGTSNYNPTTPGTSNYNPTTPGIPGTDATILGVYFPGGASGTTAPTISPTPTTLVYTGDSGISVTVPTGGYVSFTSKRTNT